MKKEFSQNIYRIESSVLGNVVTMLDERCSKCIDKACIAQLVVDSVAARRWAGRGAAGVRCVP